VRRNQFIVDELYISLAIYVTGAVVLFTLRHPVGGGVLLACAARVALITGL
jgi:hypothetical protein